MENLDSARARDGALSKLQTNGKAFSYRAFVVSLESAPRCELNSVLEANGYLFGLRKRTGCKSNFAARAEYFSTMFTSSRISALVARRSEAAQSSVRGVLRSQQGS